MGNNTLLCPSCQGDRKLNHKAHKEAFSVKIEILKWTN